MERCRASGRKAEEAEVLERCEARHSIVLKRFDNGRRQVKGQAVNRRFYRVDA